MQGQLRGEKLSCIVESACGHCQRPMRLEVDSDLNIRPLEAGPTPVVYVPMLDVRQLEPSIIDGF